MQRILTFILIITFSTTLLSQNNDNIDYEVYSKVIDIFNDNILQKWQHKTFGQILINSDTDFKNTFKTDTDYPNNVGFCLSCKFQENGEVLYDSIFINSILHLDTINQKSMQFDNKFKIKRYNTKILTRSDFNSYFKNDGNGWDKLNREYKRTIGFLTLSKLLISDDGQICTVYISFEYSDLGAIGCILRIDLINEKILTKEILWQS